MKKFLKNILWFIVFVAIGYPILIFLIAIVVPQKYRPNVGYRINSYGDMYERLKEVKNISDVDILFLGGSDSYRGFDVRIFNEKGYSAFNLGSSSQTPIQTNLLLDKYFEQLDPEIIIYAVSPAIFSSDGIESSLDIFANDKIDIKSVELAIKQNHIKTYNTLFVGIIADIFNLNNTIINIKQKFGNNSIHKLEDTYISGGYVETKKTEFTYNDVYYKESFNIREEQVDAFEKIMQKINKNNSKIIFVYTPIVSYLYEYYGENNHLIDSLLIRNGEYYNFNEILYLKDSIYFYDPCHLNQKGVEKFNYKLIEVLEL